MSTQHLHNIALKDFCRFLLKAGCVLDRTTGGHFQYRHPKSRRTLTLPTHKSPVRESIVKNLLRELGISRKEFFEIMKQL